MKFGDPPKALAAARLAAVFSYVALFGHDHVAVAGWSDAVDRYLPPQSGTHAVSRVWTFIDALMRRPDGVTDFRSLRSGGPVRRRGGLAIVLSDFLTESDWRSGLLALQSAGQEVVVVQVLARDELDPNLYGDWELRDAETGTALEVTGTSRLLRRYHDSLREHLAALSAFCRAHRMSYLTVASDESLEGTLLTRLQLAGILS
jgi:uncharacterized protein (DUF58 family)